MGGSSVLKSQGITLRSFLYSYSTWLSDLWPVNEGPQRDPSSCGFRSTFPLGDVVAFKHVRRTGGKERIENQAIRFPNPAGVAFLLARPSNLSHVHVTFTLLSRLQSDVLAWLEKLVIVVILMKGLSL